MNYTFKSHQVGPAVKRWLKEAAVADSFDPRAAKAKLWRDLPSEFTSDKVDVRLYNHGLRRPTLLGLWHVDPENPIFKMTDATIGAVRELIVENPGIVELRVDSIARKATQSEQEVARVIHELAQLGGYFTGMSGPNANPESIELGDERTYNAFLYYKGVDDVLERFYVSRDPANSPSLSVFASSPPVFFPGYTVPNAGVAVQPVEHVSIKKGVAFVLMAIDPGKPELEDVYNTIKDACQEFGIRAYRADEIQHQDRITEIILDEIRTCEYLIADLTHERPNVYYEVGFAHALDKKPILYRRSGTHLHFDLSVHNVPEYKNVTELRHLLRLRLEAITGRSPAKN
jgi:hypothetical protein